MEIQGYARTKRASASFTLMRNASTVPSKHSFDEQRGHVEQHEASSV